MEEHLKSLKAVNSEISRQDVIDWFNNNDIDYWGWTDLEMYIHYIEKGGYK